MSIRFAALTLTLLLAGCGLRDYVFDLMEGEENAEPPAKLVDFAPGASVEEVWSESIGEGTKKQFLKLQPIAVDGQIYSAGRGGDVYALNAASGKQAWQNDLEVPITGGPGAGESLVLVGTSDGEVIALQESDGKQAWRAQVSSEVLAAPKAAEGVVIVRTLDGKIFGLDASDGKQLWVYDRQVPILTLRGTSAPVLVRGLAIAGFDSGNLVALELKSGKVAWEANVAPPRGRSEFERMVDIDAEPLVEGDTLYIAAFQHGVIAVSLSSGRIEWTKDLSSYAGLSADSDNIYLSDDKGQVWALDRESGRAVWKQNKLQARAVTAPAVIDDYVVVGDLEGYLHWLAKEDGQFVARVRVDKSPMIAAPFAVDNTLYAYSSAGTLGAFQVKGKIERPETTPEPETADAKTDESSDQPSMSPEDSTPTGDNENAEDGKESAGEDTAKSAAENAKADDGTTPPPAEQQADKPTSDAPPSGRRRSGRSLNSSDWLYP